MVAMKNKRKSFSQPNTSNIPATKEQQLTTHEPTVAQAAPTTDASKPITDEVAIGQPQTEATKTITVTETLEDPLATLHETIEEVDEATAKLLTSGNYVGENSSSISRQSNAILAVVNHHKGQRVKLHSYVRNRIDVKAEDYVNVSVQNHQIFIMKDDDGRGIQLKKGGMLYNKELVDIITQEFSLDFSKQSTNHLMQVTYKKWNDRVIAIITK